VSSDLTSSVRLSVVLPVLNESTDIGALLESLLSQHTVPGGFEVIVADGGSSDGTRDIVRRFSGRSVAVRLFDNPRRRSGPARNIGAGHARGEFVLYLDGHCSLPRADYLRRVVEIFDESGADCLSRPQLLDEMVDGSWAAAIAAARHSWFGHASGSDIYGCEPGPTDPRSAGAAYRRSHWVELGGYDERFDACEDVEFNHRIDEAGLLSYGHPDLTVHYRPRASVRGLFWQMHRYGRGRARLMFKHPSMRPMPLLAVTGGLFVVLVLLATGQAVVGGTLAGVGIGAWLAVAWGEGLRHGQREDQPLPAALRIVVAFAAIYGGLLFGFWRGLFEGWRYRGKAGPVTVGQEL
jgi:succinoglycan biosynthesis protein ExoA